MPPSENDTQTEWEYKHEHQPNGFPLRILKQDIVKSMFIGKKKRPNSLTNWSSNLYSDCIVSPCQRNPLI